MTHHPNTMPLSALVTRFRPECHGRPQETWAEHAARLWRDEPEHMARLALQIAAGWSPDKPAVVHDGYVQDGHHRIAAALDLGWHGRPVPVEVLPSC